MDAELTHQQLQEIFDKLKSDRKVIDSSFTENELIQISEHARKERMKILRMANDLLMANPDYSYPGGVETGFDYWSKKLGIKDIDFVLKMISTEWDLRKANTVNLRSQIVIRKTPEYFHRDDKKVNSFLKSQRQIALFYFYKSIQGINDNFTDNAERITKLYGHTSVEKQVKKYHECHKKNERAKQTKPNVKDLRITINELNRLGLNSDKANEDLNQALGDSEE